MALRLVDYTDDSIHCVYQMLTNPGITRGPAGLFRDAGFATFIDDISGNGMRYRLALYRKCLFFYSINGKDMISSRGLGTNEFGNIRQSIFLWKPFST